MTCAWRSKFPRVATVFIRFQSVWRRRNCAGNLQKITTIRIVCQLAMPEATSLAKSPIQMTVKAGEWRRTTVKAPTPEAFPQMPISPPCFRKGIKRGPGVAPICTDVVAGKTINAQGSHLLHVVASEEKTCRLPRNVKGLKFRPPENTA